MRHFSAEQILINKMWRTRQGSNLLPQNHTTTIFVAWMDTQLTMESFKNLAALNDFTLAINKSATVLRQDVL